MAKVLIMGSDATGEQTLLQRLHAVSGMPGLSLTLCHDFSDCDLLVVRDNPMLCKAAQRIASNHPWLPMWSLADDGSLRDALHEPPAPLDDAQVRAALQRLHVVAQSSPKIAPIPELPATQDMPLGVAMRMRLTAADTVAALTLEESPLLLLDFRRLLAVVPPGAPWSDQAPAQVLGREFGRLSLRTLPPAQYSALFVDLPSVPLIPLLWQASLRMQVVPELLAPLHEGSRLHLQRWPDFRVLAHRHDDFRLCSLLLRRASTVLEASHALGVDPGATRAFFNAAWLSGYANVEVEAVADPPRARGPGALLASMWRGIRRSRGG